MPVITGFWGKLLNVLLNVLKSAKSAGLFQRGPKPPVAGLIILGLLATGCAHLGEVVKDCVALAETCEIETSNGKCICKPEPVPTPVPTPQPSPTMPPTPPIPPVEPTPTPSPTLPPPPACDLPPMPECGGPGPAEGPWGCCSKGEGIGQFVGVLMDAQDELGISAIDPEKAKEYTEKLALLLRTKYGVCAVSGGPKDEVGIKTKNSYSEQYDVVTGQGFIWQQFAAKCEPARF